MFCSHVPHMCFTTCGTLAIASMHMGDTYALSASVLQIECTPSSLVTETYTDSCAVEDKHGARDS